MLKFEDMFEKEETEYEKLFNDLLKRYKAKKIEDLDEKNKKKFFNELDKLVK